MRHLRNLSIPRLTHLGGRLCALLDLVAVRLAIEVLLVVEPASPVLVDQMSGSGAQPIGPAALDAGLTCSDFECRPHIFVDPTSERLDALTAWAPGSTVSHHIASIRATLVLRAGHDVSRDLLPTARLIAELIEHTLKAAVPVVRSSFVESGSLVAAGRGSDG